MSAWRSSKEKGPKAQDRKRRAGRDDVARSCLQSALCGNFKKLMQVRWDDQPQYHQGLESVFVGGRLSALLPPPAKNSNKKPIRKEPRDSRGYTLTIVFS